MDRFLEGKPIQAKPPSPGLRLARWSRDIDARSDLEDVVLRMLAKRPADRYQTPAQLLADLDRIGKFAGLTC